MNPDYIKLAQIAYDTVIQVMADNADHGEEWLTKDIEYHKSHAMAHADNAYFGSETEDDTAHCLVRCTMIKYLEHLQEISAIPLLWYSVSCKDKNKFGS